MRNLSEISQFPLKELGDTTMFITISKVNYINNFSNIFLALCYVALQAIFAVHFLLVAWILEGWSSQSMAFYNLLFLLSVMWAIHHTESDEPVQFALFLNVASEFFDFINLSTKSPFDGSTYLKFSASMVIVNMIVRIFTSMYLLRIGQSRGGSLSTMFSSPAMGLGRQDYKDISQPIPQNSDFSRI